LIAHNTDTEGFLGPLRSKTEPSFLKTNPSLVFGAGGAARATIGALIKMGVAEIRVCTRRDKQAETMVSQINLPNIHVVPWKMRQISVATAGLIINATTAGMHGRTGLDITLANSRKDVLVYDLIYTPIKTPLIQQAEDLGRSYLGGLDMLIAMLLKHLETPHSS